MNSHSLARNTDPVTSHLAAEEMILSGAASKQRDIAYAAVLDNPGLTSLELVDHCDLDRYQLARRLADLSDMGLVEKGAMRKCLRSGRKSVTWTTIKVS